MFRIYLLILSMFLSGCTTVWARLTYTFETLETNPVINYEQGAEDIAKIVGENIETDIEFVSKHLGLPFRNIDALDIYVFSSKERYANFSSSSPRARGSATTNGIYISPIIRESVHTVVPITRHELTHAHLRQYVGTWRYWTEIPGWYHEGIAVLVSEGGGAETVSEEKALGELKSGNYFTPRESSSIFGHKFAHDYGLDPHLYYRQSANFIQYLMKMNESYFKNTYIDIVNGESFIEVWRKNYGKSINMLWLEYLERSKA